jgi:hypothetical protein
MARRFHDVQIGGAPFSIDVRYQNLKQIGGGSYGIVCSADDTVENRFILPLVSLVALFWFHAYNVSSVFFLWHHHLFDDSTRTGVLL